jgi:hypothetical protein
VKALSKTAFSVGHDLGLKKQLNIMPQTVEHEARQATDMVCLLQHKPLLYAYINSSHDLATIGHTWMVAARAHRGERGCQDAAPTKLKFKKSRFGRYHDIKSFM